MEKNNLSGLKEDFIFYLKTISFLLMSIFWVIIILTYCLAVKEVNSEKLWFIYGLAVFLFGLLVIKLAPKTLFGPSIANGGSERFSNFTVGFFLVTNTVSVIAVMLFYEKNVIIETFWQYCWPVLATLGVTHLLAFIGLCLDSLLKRMKDHVKDVVVGGIVGIVFVAVIIVLNALNLITRI